MATWEVFGQVQGVMFRQTFVRGLQKRALAGGASNDPNNHQRVVVTVEGPDQAVEALMTQVGSGDVLNSRGARVDTLERLEENLDWREHQVTTLNVEQFKWREGVDFYL